MRQNFTHHPPNSAQLAAPGSAGQKKAEAPE